MKSVALKILTAFILLFSLNVAGDPGSSGTDYRLGPGDRIKVTVFGHEDLSGEFQVSGTGEISMPLIDEVNAQDLTVGELEDRIVDALQPDYLIKPRVSVGILNYRPFYIIGEVTTPGSYPYVNGMTVLNAVAVAGGFNYRARKGRISIRRGDGETSQEFEAGMDTQVEPGDVISVPERFF